MAEREYTQYEREVALWAAERDGDKATAEAFGCSEATIRSWRFRAQRKVTDKRAREDNTPPARGPARTEVMIPDGGWNPSLGQATKVAARARIIPRVHMGSEVPSNAPLRHMGVPTADAMGLVAGEILLLGGEQCRGFSDALWCVVERRGRWRDHEPYTPTLPRPYDEATGSFDGRPTTADPDKLVDFVLVIVQPARLRSDTCLSEDRTRIVERTAANQKPNPLHMSMEERLRNWDEQPPLQPPLNPAA